jgi:hypothetical protein
MVSRPTRDRPLGDDAMRPKSRSSPPFALDRNTAMHSHARNNTIAYATCNQVYERIKFNENKSTRHCRHVSPSFRPSVSLAPFLEEPVIIVIIIIGPLLSGWVQSVPLLVVTGVSVRHSGGAILRRRKQRRPPSADCAIRHPHGAVPVTQRHHLTRCPQLAVGKCRLTAGVGLFDEARFQLPGDLVHAADELWQLLPNWLTDLFQAPGHCLHELIQLVNTIHFGRTGRHPTGSLVVSCPHSAHCIR